MLHREIAHRNVYGVRACELSRLPYAARVSVCVLTYGAQGRALIAASALQRDVGAPRGWLHVACDCVASASDQSFSIGLFDDQGVGAHSACGVRLLSDPRAPNEALLFICGRLSAGRGASSSPARRLERVAPPLLLRVDLESRGSICALVGRQRTPPPPHAHPINCLPWGDGAVYWTSW